MKDKFISIPWNESDAAAASRARQLAREDQIKRKAAQNSRYQRKRIKHASEPENQQVLRTRD